MIGQKEYAGALAAAVVADMARAPTLERAVHERKISPQGLVAIVERDLEREFTGAGGPPLFPNLRALARQQLAIQQRLPAGLQQWDALITAVVPAVAGAVSKYYVARTESRTQTEIAKLQLASQQLQIKALDLTAATQRAANATASGVPGADPSLPPGTLTPAEAVATAVSDAAPIVLGVGAGAAVLYFLYKKFAS